MIDSQKVVDIYKDKIYDRCCFVDDVKIQLNCVECREFYGVWFVSQVNRKLNGYRYSVN